MKIHQWRKSFETGHAGIDDQHRKMIACLKTIREYILGGKGDKAYDECQKFRTFSDDHHAFEENILRDAGFARLETHSKTHAQTTGKMQEVFSTCGEACRKTGSAGCAEDLSFILVDHLLRGDLDFKSFLQSKNLANDGA